MSQVGSIYSTMILCFPFLAIFQADPTTFCVKDRDFVEIFSGRGEISKALRDVSYLTVWCQNLVLNFGKFRVKKMPPKSQKLFCGSGGWNVHQVLDTLPIQLGHLTLTAPPKVGMHGTSIDTCLEEKAFDLTGPAAFGCPGG